MRVYHDSTRLGKREQNTCVCQNHLPSSHNTEYAHLARSKSCPMPFILLPLRPSANAMAWWELPPHACITGRRCCSRLNDVMQGYRYVLSMTRLSLKCLSHWNMGCVCPK